MGASAKFRSFGFPYQGSKKRIAEALVSKMPPCECFVDLFAGGCSVSHIAALSGKYERLIINDLLPSAQDWLAIMHSVQQGDPFRHVYHISRDRLKNDHGINTLMRVSFTYAHKVGSTSYYVPEKYEKLGKEFFDDVFSREVLKNGDLIEAYSRFRRIAPCYRKFGGSICSIPKPVSTILNCLMTMSAHTRSGSTRYVVPINPMTEYKSRMGRACTATFLTTEQPGMRVRFATETFIPGSRLSREQAERFSFLSIECRQNFAKC